MAKAWCKHYRGMHKSESCDAGVKFSSLPGHWVKGFLESCPCFGPGHEALCDKAKYPTADELAAEDKEMAERFANTCKARVAIVAACGGPWKRGSKGESGAIDCPVCNATESLRFTRAGYNGHIHAACCTEGCVRWME